MFGLTKTISAIHINISSIRAVRLTLRGKDSRAVKVASYAERTLPKGVLAPSYSKSNIADIDRFRENLLQTLTAAGITKGDVALSIPEQVVKVSFMDIKGVSREKNEVLKFIKWKSKRLLPYDPEEAVIDYSVMGDTALTVFVKKEVVSGYEDALLSLSLRPVFVTFPSLSIFNMLSDIIGREQVFAFVTILEDAFSVLVMKDGIITFHRSGDAGIFDDRILNEVTSSILFYLSENTDVAIKKIFLNSFSGADELRLQISDSAGLDVEAIQTGRLVAAPMGMGIESYGPAIAAAMEMN